MKADLVQIQEVPPFHQSTEFLTSCPVMYVESVIKGNAQPGGMDSARGRQVHATGAKYVTHCALQRVSTDLKAFDEFTAGAGPLAARILAGMRDGYEVDWEHFLAAELTLSLDAHFRPTHIPEAIAGTCADSGEEPMVVGTLDALYAFPDQGMMRIDDWKSHPRPFNPGDKLQSKTYALMVFQHWPWVQKITFRLIFVRYRKAIREVEFTRDQIPDLVAVISAARERQKKIHVDYETGDEIEAVAGSHCFYCPLLSNATCPIAKYNANMQLTMSQRFNFNLWYGQFSRANNAVMKAYVQETGRDVVLRDYNGKAYTYGYVERETLLYPVFQFDDLGRMVVKAVGQPLLPIIELLYDYAHSTPEDVDWMKNVVISSTALNKYLKTKGRVNLDQAIEDTATRIPVHPIRVSKPLDAVDLPDEEDESWDEEEEL